MTILIAALVASVITSAAVLRTRIKESVGTAWNAQLGVSERTDGLASRIADGPFSARYLLCKSGSDTQHVTPLESAADQPFGTAVDQPYREGDVTAVRLLGARQGTQTLIAAGAINQGAAAYSDGTGRVMAEPTEPGTYWLVGRIVGGAALNPGDYLEVETCQPKKVVVLAAIESAQIGNDPTETQFNGLQADVANLAAAMGTGALFKVL
jgi:hypothetical protein